MKKAIFTLAIFVMAFGISGFAQNKATLKSMSKELVFKQYGFFRESYIVPQQANFFGEDGTQHRTTYYYDESEFYLNEEITETNLDFWMNETRIAYEYDFFGNVTEALYQEWNVDDWEDMTKVTYTYEGEVISEVVYQYFMNGMWNNAMKEVYNYNGDMWTVLIWDWNGTTWASDLLHTYTRNGNTIELVIQYMQGGAWQNQERQIFTLDFDENVTEILIQGWMNSAWEDDEKIIYTYVDGVYTEQLLQFWTGSWEDVYKYNFEYDGMGNAKHGECKERLEGVWLAADGDIDMAYGYNAQTKTFYAAEVEMTYVDLTKVDENAQTNCSVYPNPADGEIQVQTEGFQKVEIYSLTGQLMLESLCSTLDVSGLASGVYLVKIVDQTGNSEMQRLVVK